MVSVSSMTKCFCMSENVNKQVYEVTSEIVEFIRDNDDKVKILDGIYIKKLQLIFL